jgi:hypothetical protein
VFAGHGPWTIGRWHTICVSTQVGEFVFRNETAGSSVFAANTHSKFYHLVEVEMRTARSLCGLKVAMIIEPEPCSAALHLVSAEPANYLLCTHCRRVVEGQSTGEEPLKAKATTL